MNSTALLFALFAGALPTQASAQTVTYTFDGTITNNFLGLGAASMWDAVQTGDPFTLVCTVDGLTIGTPSSPNRASYSDAILSIDININGVIGAPAVGVNSITVSNDFTFNSNCNDGLEFGTGTIGDGILNLFFGLSANSTLPACPSALTSLDLPTSLDIADFPIGFLSMAAGADFIEGTITGVTVNSVIANDDCANATLIGPGLIPFDTTFATTDGVPLDPLICDMGPFGDENIQHDIWYCFAAPASATYRVSTVGLVGFDTRLAVYDNSCGADDPATVVACNDNAPGAPFEAELSFSATAGQNYKVRLGGYSAGSVGAGELRITGIPATVSFCFGDGLGRPCKCGNDDTLNPSTGGCLNSNGTGAVLSTNDATSVSSNDLQFTLAGGTPTALAVLTSGDNALGGGIGILGMPDSDGLRCVGVNFMRHGSRSLDGTGSNTWGVNGIPAAGIIGQASFVVGQTRHFQMRYREDPIPGPCGFATNTSQALGITFAP